MINYPPRSSRALWVFFALTLILTAAFIAAMSIWDFTVIDEMYHADQIQSHVELMSPLQRRVHIIVTATLDVLYPLIYGGLFAGLCLNAFPKYKWLAAPALICIPVDLLEGVSQIRILQGHMSWIDVKVIVTPIKLGLFFAALLLALLAVLKISLQWQQSRRPKGR